MNDWGKLLIAGGVGAAAAIAWKNYQDEQALEQARLAQAQRGATGRLTDIALQAAQEIASVNMDGVAGHMAMPPPAPSNAFHGQAMRRVSMPPAVPNAFHQQAMQRPPLPPHASNGFYGQVGMRQSAPGNPHAPVIVPRHRPATPPPPPAPPRPQDSTDSNGTGAESEYEHYGDDNQMGGQRF